MSCQPISNPPYNWTIPDSYPKPQLPEENPMSAEKVQLGRYLFYDKNLSANRTQSCSSCHQQAYAFSEPRQVSRGSTGQLHRRNALALVNVAYNKTLTWAHPTMTTLEQQILIPMFGEHPIELGITHYETRVLERFETPVYAELFEEAFDSTEVSFLKINQALASFVRSLTSFNTRFDQYAYHGQDSALTESEIRGLNLFFSERLECHHCHNGFNFTESTSHERQLVDLRAFHNTGLYNFGHGRYPGKDPGLVELTFRAQDNGAFRTPTLRNIALTAPYMHDGSIETLEEVIDFYSLGGRDKGIQNPYKSPFVDGFELSKQEKRDLLAFLHSLTDTEFINDPNLSNPFLEYE